MKKSVGNILILTYWGYKEGLIQTYTLPYVRMIRKTIPTGNKIFFFTLEKDTMKVEDPQATSQDLLTEGINWLPHQYVPFGGKGMLKWALIIPKLWWLILTKKITHIHCFCTPPGMIGYLLSIFTRRKLVIDSYEPHAESMIENGEWQKEGKAYKLLSKYEKKQSQRAEHFISATEGMRDYARKTYQVDPKSFFVKPACVDLDLFSWNNIKKPALVKELDLNDKVVAVYAGKFGGIYLDHEVFDFLKVAYDFWGEKFRVIILTNHTQEELDAYCEKACVPKNIIIRKFVMHHEVPDYMGLADFALTPVKPIPTKRYCTPIKDGEYWALGLPVVITRDISDDSDIIEKHNAGAVIHSFDTKAYQEAVVKINTLITSKSRKELFDEIRQIAIKYRSMSVAEKIYQEVYGS